MEDFVDGPPDSDARRWALFIHLSGLALLSGIPFAEIILPFIIWATKRDEHPFIDENGKEALNFQISYWIYIVVATTVCVILMFIAVGLLFVPVIVVLALAKVLLPLLGAVRTNDGTIYRYPFTIRFL